MKSEPWSRADLERKGALAALVLVATGAFLRFRGISDYWLNADEGIYYSTLTRATFDGFWAEVVANAHPPVFYLLLRGLGHLTWDFALLRAVPALFGVAAIWVFWLVGRTLGGPGWRGVLAGLVSAALLALNPEAIVLSQVMRPYTLVVLLLAGALYGLLRYRREPELGSLTGYAVLLGIAVLTHYSAALAVGVFSLVLAHDGVTGHLSRSSLTALLVAHAVPIALLAALWVLHIGPALESELMGEALDPGGWLSAWLVGSPSDAWDGLVAYQAFHLPVAFRGRALLLLLAAVIVSISTRNRMVALLGAGAIAVAMTASAAGIYPFGPSRHNAWLTVFTIPALGWLAGRLVASRRTALVGVGALALLLLAGGPLERGLAEGGTPSEPIRTNATEEQVIRRADIAPLVVERMGPDAGPELVLMSEQSFNVLMPLYAEERQGMAVSGDSTLAHFRYGQRDVVVALRWEWSGAAEVARVLSEIPEALPWLRVSRTAPVLVVAGGWGSGLLAEAARLQREGIILDGTWALGRDAAGEPTVRMMAMLIDPQGLVDARPGD